MCKKKIVIASILKPVNDTRMFEKFGLSLGQTNKYEINIIGFSSKKYYNHLNINFYSLFSFKRLNFRRVFSPIIYFFTLIKLKPHLIIVTTPELLVACCVFKAFSKCKLIYDIQENYRSNILYSQVYPPIIKNFLAFSTRKIEIISAKCINHFFLAENSYKYELPFIADRYSIIANKYKELLPESGKREKDTDAVTLLFTGTIAKNYGILQAVEFTKALYLQDSKIRLIIAGYCQDVSLLNELKRRIAGCSYISLIGGDKLVPHEEILQLIKTANFGLVPYQPDPSIEKKIPTKLYEYLANQLPVILQSHPLWEDFCAPYQAAIPIDFNHFSPNGILDQMKKKDFYAAGNRQNLLWQSEEVKLLKAVEGVFY